MKGYSINELKLGQIADMSKTVTEYDIYSFAGITGDFNPAHINEQYAKDTPFNERIAHGMLSAGFISACIGMKLPGPGTIYLSQNIKFTQPVRIGDTITAVVEVIEKDMERNRVKLKTTCSNQQGTVVITGEALVMPPLK